ncbi:MAG: phosphate acyltransferase PlsX [Firmicutes bacterium]|nr:phosphate acyltransferase PlsX [Bacillota bacterium]
MKIALDAMGGDFAPREEVRGAIAACQDLGVEVILVGDPTPIEAELSACPMARSLPLTVVAASERIGMGEHPAAAVKKKRQASVVVANELVRNGQADGVVSAGNTGAAMAASLLRLGRLPGIDRPAIAIPMPTATGVTVLLDAGANADCTAENLLQFAFMGAIYAERVLGLSHPRVGLLNIGEEETKGNALAQAAYPLLASSGLNFIGNVEGRDLHRGAADVVVCDGFVGNVVLKVSEGLATVLFAQVKEAATASFKGRLGGLLLRPSLYALRKRLDYAEYGGAPLLGVNGVSIIAHGRSNARAIRNAIGAAAKAAGEGIVEMIRQALSPSPGGENR